MAKATRRKGAQKKQDSTIWIVGAAVAAVALVLILVFINLNSSSGAQTPPSQVSAGRMLGQESAPVLVEEYADYQCPFCARADTVLRQLAPKYIDTGKVKWVFRNFAFIGDESLWAAEAAECANEQGKFWEYNRYLFDHQTGENVGAYTKDNLKRFAQELNLDTAAFNACLDSGRHSALVQAETNEGRARGVNSTPSFFINGRYVRGLLPADQFGLAIDSFLPQSP